MECIRQDISKSTNDLLAAPITRGASWIGDNTPEIARRAHEAAGLCGLALFVPVIDVAAAICAPVLTTAAIAADAELVFSKRADSSLLGIDLLTFGLAKDADYIWGDISRQPIALQVAKGVSSMFEAFPVRR
jgi:hypothetical protein